MIAATAVDEFLQKIEAVGLVPPPSIIADGRLHRFSSNGNPGDGAGWYCFFPGDVPAGAFGCWRQGVKETWCAKSSCALTEQELQEYREQIAAAQGQRDEEERRQHAEAAERAQHIWDEAQPASDEHSYLQRKGVKAYGLRISQDGRLIVPIYQDGTLSSLQLIDAHGEKRYLSGGAKQGGLYTVGDDPASTHHALAEGYATAATIHEATGLPATVAFDAGNMGVVAESLRQKYPTTTLIVCADNDLHHEGKPNVGIAAASAAAQAVGGVIAIPNLDGRKCDFNDLAVERGLGAVSDAIKAVVTSMPAGSIKLWPQLDSAALHGLAGDIIALLDAHTEADPVALLVTTLSEFGCCIGRAPHSILDGSRHPLLFWPIIVGKSSKSRKGSSERRTGALFRQADPHWTRGECRGTLSSGEGLVYAVRDPSFKDERNRNSDTRERCCIDPGIEDKRLFLVQSEFGAVLRVMHREGSSLSGVVRDAWDGQDLCPMTKNNPIRATQPHIAIVGHITMDELRRNLAGTEMSNGFANRFAFFLVRRSKELPEASEPDQEQVMQVVGRLREAISHGRTVNRITMTEAARRAWRSIYSDLSADRPGTVGALLGRAEAQVQRMAALYCLLDLQRQVDAAHLEAAVALWQYAESSTSHLFGDSTGDPDADTILAALCQSGELTDTDISALFGFNRTSGRLNHAKQILQAAGLAECAMQEKAGKGRRVTVWRLKSRR